MPDLPINREAIEDNLTSIMYGADWKRSDIADAFKPDVAAAMTLIDSYAASLVEEAREDENQQALADFEPEFLRLQRPHQQGRLTRVGEETFEQLKRRSRYHHSRLKELRNRASTLLGRLSEEDKV